MKHLSRFSILSKLKHFSKGPLAVIRIHKLFHTDEVLNKIEGVVESTQILENFAVLFAFWLNVHISNRCVVRKRMKRVKVHYILLVPSVHTMSESE